MPKLKFAISGMNGSDLPAALS